jgi:hypothetical protein
MAASVGSGDGDRADVSSVLKDRTELTCRIREILDRAATSDRWRRSTNWRRTQNRFTELKRGIPGISQRMLTATVRRRCAECVQILFSSAVRSSKRWNAPPAKASFPRSKSSKEPSGGANRSAG